MPAQVDLSKLSVRQFAERFKSEMIPLSNTFSYFCASAPLSEEDLKEYLEEPVAALPPAVAAALPKISILLVPYLERSNGAGSLKAIAKDGARVDLPNFLVAASSGIPAKVARDRRPLASAKPAVEAQSRRGSKSASNTTRKKTHAARKLSSVLQDA